MMNLLRIFALLIIIVVSACKKTGDSVIQGQAKEFKNFVSKEPFEFFLTWDNIGSIFNVTNPSALYALGYCGLYYKSLLEPVEFFKTIEKLESLSLFKGNLKDTLYYFVPDFTIQSPKNKFPTPSLKDPVYNIIDSVDVENTFIFGLRQERGNFFTEKGINKAKKFSRPQDHDKIGNGYSNGAIVDYSSKKIIYWIIVW